MRPQIDILARLCAQDKHESATLVYMKVCACRYTYVYVGVSERTTGSCRDYKKYKKTHTLLRNDRVYTEEGECEKGVKEKSNS